MTGVGQAVRDGVNAAKDGLLHAANGAQGTPAKGALMPNVKFNTDYLTTNAGTPVMSNQFTLRAGPRGPALLEDYHLLEKLGQFNREKTPERVVHARGMVAKGYFEVTHDVTHLTCADFLSEVDKKTHVSVRLSTVTHEKGSPESLRDVRGFSVKFYTDEGNWDFVGNNIPVFFIRDGSQFPDLVHALRPNPKNHIQEGWRILDFLAHHPESCHVLTWLLDETGIPKSWRHLEGYSVNTFKLVDRSGHERYVKFHWRPTIGAEFLSDDEAKMVGEDNARHSHATADLYNAIAEEHYPEWTFHFQVVEIDGAEATLGFDPLDDTKEWPEDKFPLIPVGKMVLNENITNFHNEAEGYAVDPGITIPGINVSNDPVLQSRVLAYADTQRYRLGVNYQLLPINQPKCPFHNNHHDGLMQMTVRDEEVNYYPSMVEKKAEHPATHYTLSREKVEGVRVAQDLPLAGMPVDDYKQAGDRIRSMNEKRYADFTKHLVAWMSQPKCTAEIRDAWYNIWTKADAKFGAHLKAEVEKVAPQAGHPKKVGATNA